MSDQHERKSRLLGMSFGTARARLERDVLFSLVAGSACFRCGQPLLERENFSIEHKNIWSIAPDPKAAFFDIENVAFSHHRCNSAHTSKLNEHGKGGYDRGCRCDVCRAAKSGARAEYDPMKRRNRYLKYGT